MSPLMTPVPNLNGNSAESLLEQLGDIRVALLNAKRKMAQASDLRHGRNFQHLTGDEHRETVQQAQAAWGERMVLLDEMFEETFEMALAIQRQGEQP